jgi:hypothetical protein
MFHIFVGARIYSNGEKVLLYFLNYGEIFDASLAASQSLSQPIDSSLVNHLWMIDYLNAQDIFDSKFMTCGSTEIFMRTMADMQKLLKICNFMHRVLQDNMTKQHIAVLEAAFLKGTRNNHNQMKTKLSLTYYY